MKKRLITAIVLVGLIVLALTVAPVWLFKILVLILIAGALHEFYRLVIPNDLFGSMSGLIFGLIFSVLLIFVDIHDHIFPIFLFVFFILILAHMIYYTTVERVLTRLGLIMFGTAYLAFTLPSFVWLRLSDHGRALIVFTIAIVALGDSFAYGIGKLIGKHKLSPLISPNKTIEGFIASFFGGVLASFICWTIFWPELSVLLVIFLGISVALIGALGDLVESLVKRAYHIKDSGNLLPGHGGILDRIDALIFAAPFVYFTFKLLGKI